jgi:hypothetical protein
MTDFAKLFITPHGQLLVTKEFDEEYQLAFRGHGNSFCSPTVTMNFSTKEARESAYEAVGQEEADKHAKDIAATVISIFGEYKGEVSA